MKFNYSFNIGDIHVSPNEKKIHYGAVNREHLPRGTRVIEKPLILKFDDFIKYEQNKPRGLGAYASVAVSIDTQIRKTFMGDYIIEWIGDSGNALNSKTVLSSKEYDCLLAVVNFNDDTVMGLVDVSVNDAEINRYVGGVQNSSSLENTMSKIETNRTMLESLGGTYSMVCEDGSLVLKPLSLNELRIYKSLAGKNRLVDSRSTVSIGAEQSTIKFLLGAIDEGQRIVPHVNLNVEMDGVDPTSIIYFDSTVTDKF